MADLSKSTAWALGTAEGDAKVMNMCSLRRGIIRLGYAGLPLANEVNAETLHLVVKMGLGAE